MTPVHTTPADAIARSISHDEIARYGGSLAELLAYADAEGYETDQARENDGSIDVWGWTATTSEGEQDWRVRVTHLVAD